VNTQELRKLAEAAIAARAPEVELWKFRQVVKEFHDVVTPEFAIELLDKIDRLQAELGDLPEAQNDMLKEIKRLKAELAEAKRDITNYLTTAMAAAVEIQEHWDAHCDEEGYGPVNLMRRLENGFPESYGYTAKTVVELTAERDELRAKLAALEKQEPMFWVRLVGSDGLYEGPVHHKSVGGKMMREEKPGEWKPLYLSAGAKE
jgi:regulator of replication initiation timing